MVLVDRTSCVAQIEGKVGTYGYQPSLGAGIAFCVLFGGSMLGHTLVSFRYRTWWQIVFSIGALTELIGWAGRTWSHFCPYENNPFLMQICTLIFAPAFFAAGIYIILGRLIRTFGSRVSPIEPNTYLYIFCTVDLISLVVQAVGGGIAATAFEETPPENSEMERGTHMMVAGILFQLASIIVFALLFTYVINKALRNRGEMIKQKKIRFVIGATVLSVIVLVIRSIYRTIELLQGWNGYLINAERYFIALDGTMMILFVGVFNLVQPRWSEAWEVKTGGVFVREEMVTASEEGNK